MHLGPCAVSSIQINKSSYTLYLSGIWSCSAAFSMDTEQEVQIGIRNDYNNLTDSYAVWNTTLKNSV